MPDKKFDIIVIGGGAAGLVAAVAAGAFGAKTALIEKDKLGGECSWTGCIPSKALLASAELIHKVKQSPWLECGFSSEGKTLLESNVMEHVRSTVKSAAKASKASALLKHYAVEVTYGNPVFVNSNTISLEHGNYSARHFIICSGSSPAIPDIEGLEPGYLTNQNIWDLPRVPKSLMVIGGGPIGVEMAQAFNRLGSRVELIQSRDRLLPRDDQELALELGRLLLAEGINIHFNSRVKEVKKLAKGWRIEGILENDQPLETDELLIASGRKANLNSLNLEAAGVHYSASGITVNNYMRTSVKHIWAAGDCTGRFQFSHIAEIEAKTAVMNALFPLKRKVNYQGLPWATFTDPELAHLGLTEEECVKKNLKYKIYRQAFKGDDRAITEGNTEGMVKIITTPYGRIIGAHILGPRAGELINELVLARYKKIGVFALGQSIHVYPTLGLAVQRATDEWFAELAGRPLVTGLAKLFSNRV
jgi:pyruvate/2-oxoglutarate dehydrogenase complex dihydrolipoamide dehydrogenase (E3) component